jgi:hypothetical protein
MTTFQRLILMAVVHVFIFSFYFFCNQYCRWKLLADQVCWVCLPHIQIICTKLAEPKYGLANMCIQWHVHLGIHLDHSIYLYSSFALNVDILLVCAAALH